MPTYKIVLFADDSQPTQVQYMKNQKKAIEDAIPDLVVEEANQNDARLKRHSKQLGSKELWESPKCPRLLPSYLINEE